MIVNLKMVNLSINGENDQFVIFIEYSVNQCIFRDLNKIELKLN